MDFRSWVKNNVDHLLGMAFYILETLIGQSSVLVRLLLYFGFIAASIIIHKRFSKTR